METYPNGMYITTQVYVKCLKKFNLMVIYQKWKVSSLQNKDDFINLDI